MKEAFLKNPELLERFEKDAEVLMNEDLLALKGGSAMSACSCCCTEKNGGSREVEKLD